MPPYGVIVWTVAWINLAHADTVNLDSCQKPLNYHISNAKFLVWALAKTNFEQLKLIFTLFMLYLAWMMDDW